MRFRLLPVFVFFLLFVFIRPSVAAEYEEFMAKGKADLQGKNYSAAEEAFRSALAINPESHDALLHLGIVLSRQGKRKEAESYLKQALLRDPSDPLTNLEIGKLYQRERVFSEAADFYESVTSLAPDSDYAREAARLIKDIDRKIKEMESRKLKRWALGISLGVQYDSNVILGSDEVELPEGISRMDDFRAITTVAGSYRAFEMKKFRSSIGYSFYQSLHLELSRFNVQAHSAKAAASYDMLGNVRLKGSYSFDYIFVGSRKYSQAHNVSPAILIAEGKGFLTMVEYKLTANDFEDSDRFATNSERTGDTHIVGVSQLVPITGSLRLKGGYSYRDTSAEAPYQEYDGNTVFLLLLFNLPYEARGNLYGEYFVKDYKSDHPTSGSPREDDMQTYSVSLSRDLLSWLGISVSYLYIRNDSNITDFDYDRSIAGTVLTARF
jgi:tetratricopeptide (TPR) repeat protein